MLFVSRYIDRFSYGVVDTDDGHEETVNSSEIAEAIDKWGLEIKGVTRVNDGTLGFRIVPWQDVSKMSMLQLKTNLLHHVEVVTFGNMVTSVVWRSTEMIEHVSVRLSDFGTVLEDRFLHGNTRSGFGRVRLLLDDKISVSRLAFDEPPISFTEGLGVVIDVSDIKELTTVIPVYRKLASNLGSYQLRDIVADAADRKETVLKMLSEG